MVAIFTGLGAGFERGSGSLLGAAGLLGSSSLGRGSEGVFLNAANGNLLLTHQDEFLIGRGPDVGISRTYNSLGTLDENGDHWRQSTDRRVFGLTGIEGVIGSTVQRISADGSVITYTCVSPNAYVALEGSGGQDKLIWSSASGGSWTWLDADSRITETYTAYGADSWRIVQQADVDGNTLTFSYTGGQLYRVTTADSSYTEYT